MITARTLVELKAKIYAAHGWRRRAGESMAARIKELYEVTLDAKKNRFVATLKDNRSPETESIADRWRRLTQ